MLLGKTLRYGALHVNFNARDSCEIIALLAQRTAYFFDWLFHFICIRMCRNSIAIYEMAIMFVSSARALFLPSFLLRINEYYTRSTYIFEWKEYLHNLHPTFGFMSQGDFKNMYMCLLRQAEICSMNLMRICPWRTLLQAWLMYTWCFDNYELSPKRMH